MLGRITLKDFRCFAQLTTEFAPGLNLIVGTNAQGKTSLLEAVCVLLRLQSPRVATLATAVQHGREGFALDGRWGDRHLQFHLGGQRRKLVLDGVEQPTGQTYLEQARVAWFSGHDAAMVRGTSENRRRFLDFVGAQIDPTYRRQWRDYTLALRSRNALLKRPAPNWREIAAFDGPLAAAGEALTALRAALVERLAPAAAAAHAAVAGPGETLALTYRSATPPGPLGPALAAARGNDARLRVTTVGPHRDDVGLALDGRAATVASEGQQRTVAVALRLAQVAVLAAAAGTPPLLLIDDVFGELDVGRRNALIAALPAGAQKLVSTTHLDWLAPVGGGAAEGVRLGELRDGVLRWR